LDCWDWPCKEDTIKYGRVRGRKEQKNAAADENAGRLFCNYIYFNDLKIAAADAVTSIRGTGDQMRVLDSKG
jgi:hypothetical protein